MLSPVAKFRAFLQALQGKAGPKGQQVGLAKAFMLLAQGKLVQRKDMLQHIILGGTTPGRAGKAMKLNVAGMAQFPSAKQGMPSTTITTLKADIGKHLSMLQAGQGFTQAQGAEGIKLPQSLLGKRIAAEELVLQKGADQAMGLPVVPIKMEAPPEVGLRRSWFGLLKDEWEGAFGAKWREGWSSWWKTPPLDIKKYKWHWIVRAIIILAVIILALAILL